ncbi:LacI family DNA-binding transcriptional regulator [Pseudonocardia endophytica]|uniref:LacI family transcriptional regulator n=1 Tax=Pseudonocardia endophytica TaxID=401976 RepID=A0A4R1HS71_PSEEN|nr:LacI family DNA-binding transcriptional regulator [Pseudonocardia endophytica]TCK22679.1 LacI family transcriptional regulator [Pseudonocardia endophytica]
MPSSVNLADVARLAGVSPATASRALSDHPHVAPSTRERVWRVARELEYVVSPEASRLAGGATGRVAVVVPHLSRWYFGAVLEGLEAGLRTAGLDLLLYRVGDAADRAAFFTELPARRKVDAVVLVGLAVDDEERGRLERIGVQIVAAGAQVAPHPSVRIDDHVAGRQAVDHLVHLGHKRIAMIAAYDPEQRGAHPAGRTSAYFAALADAGLPVDEELVRTVGWGADEGAEAMGTLLGRSAPPTAVYAHSDEVALGALRTLRRAGLRVPDDVSVIGVDDHPLAALTDLSTVGQPAGEVGTIAGRMVVAGLRGEAFEAPVLVPTRLVVRGSTGPPRPDRALGRRRR